jgi:predicted nucleic acid-binding protein
VAPRLLLYEVANSLHRLFLAGEIAASTADELTTVLQFLPIDFLDAHWIHERAVTLTRQFNRPATYDSHYLAIAEEMRIEFWTMDQRLYNAVKHHVPWIRLLG